MGHRLFGIHVVFEAPDIGLCLEKTVLFKLYQSTHMRYLGQICEKVVCHLEFACAPTYFFLMKDLDTSMDGEVEDSSS